MKYKFNSIVCIKIEFNVHTIVSSSFQFSWSYIHYNITLREKIIHHRREKLCNIIYSSKPHIPKESTLGDCVLCTLSIKYLHALEFCIYIYFLLCQHNYTLKFNTQVMLLNN